MQIALRQARENCRLTEKEAAKQAKIDVRTLRRWEKDDSRAGSIQVWLLLKIYGIGVDHVYSGREDEAPINNFRSAAEA